MNQALAELIKISNLTGSDTALVQGGGGNTSVKTNDGRYMYIKASGTALKDMSVERGWRRLRLETVRAILADKRLAALETDKREAEVVRRLLTACDDMFNTGARPSIESHLHAILDKYVVHLHPLVVSAYVNAKNGRTEIEKLFAQEKYPPVWIGYTDPGYALAKKMTQVVRQYQKQYGIKPAVVFLEKHGLLVSAAADTSALRLLRLVIKKCKSRLKPSGTVKAKPIDSDDIIKGKLALRRAYFATTGIYVPVRFVSNDTVRAFSRRKDAGKLLAAGPLAPDELAYADGPPLWLEQLDSSVIERMLKTQTTKGEKPAGALLVQGVGLFVAGDSKRAKIIEELATGSLMIRSWAADFGGVNALNHRQAAFINKWEAESFRREMARRIGSGDLKDRIAVVTGAGSGLGRSIAVGLARAGAMVAAADIDTGAAHETVGLIGKKLPQAVAMAVGCDVTNEKSVAQAFNSLISEWGGMDILVNAAGVAPAYALVDLPVKKWRFALEVNLTGYFLMAQQSARIMIRQRMGGSIINISSKSGLDASKNNTPYNATKAAELHMARGWALELGEFGIRVNCVCPGNVFEGSKIWNPKYIRECAKKYGIKPQDVIPYYVDKTILKRQIKGQDIADAVVFLCCDKARTITGQIIVADSGQVMVR